MGDKNEIVWLTEERTFGRLLHLGAHYALVKYTRGGIDYEVLIDHDEFKYIDEGEDADSDED